MALFNPPNIEKLYNKDSIRKLVKLLSGQDKELASRAREALLKYPGDKARAEARKKIWTNELFYNSVLKVINKLDPQIAGSINPLIKMIESEKREIEEKNELKQLAKEQLKKRFLAAFPSSTILNDSFFDILNRKLGDDPKFVLTKKMMGERPMSSYSGYVVTEDHIAIFDVGVPHKIGALRIDEIKELRYGLMKTTVKIFDEKGSRVKLDLDDIGKKAVDFIMLKNSDVIQQ